jgi:cytochrome c oxidase assembly factor CtaG
MAQIFGPLCIAGFYAAGAFRVRRRLPWWRPAVFSLGVAVLLVAVTAPLEGSFARHMTQHLLIGDLAPLCMVLGLTGPILRPVLRFRALRALRQLAHPLVALPLWAANLCVWHIGPVFTSVFGDETLHALEHVLFFTCGALLWSALLELLPGPRWFRTPQRLGYLGAMWAVSLSLSQVFIWSSRAYYYDSVDAQRVGGGIMLLEGSAVMACVLAWLLWRELGSGDRGAARTRS